VNILKNKLGRIESIINSATLNEPVSIQNLCESLEISFATFKRYISELRKDGYEISIKNGNVTFMQEGLKLSENAFTKGKYTSFRILMYIYNNPYCKKSDLKNKLCTESEESLDTLITQRALDSHLNDLMSQGLIVKQNKNGKNHYKTTDEIIPISGLDFNKTLCLINYLKVYGDTLPFQEKVAEIKDKLEISCLNYVRKSIDVVENILFTHLVFPECVLNDDDEFEEKLTSKLEQFCLEGRPLVIELKNGGIYKKYPLIIIFNWNIGCWHLVCRDVDIDDGYEFIRLDLIKSYKPCVDDILGFEKAEAEINKAWEVVDNPLTFGEGEEAHVKVAFINLTKDELAEIEHRMNKIKNASGEKSQFLYDNQECLMLQADINGTSGFLSWILKFGSKALILKNKELRKKHITIIKNAVNMYALNELAGDLNA